MKFCIQIFAFLLIIITCFIACEGNDKVDIPDVSEISVKSKFVRYDQLLKDFDSSSPQNSYLKLITTHPRITDLYFKRLVGLENPDRDSFYNNIATYFSDNRIAALADTIQDIYPDLGGVKDDLFTSVKLLKYYFYGTQDPNFYTVFTEFGYPTFIFEDMNKDGIGIGLDMFLGENFDYRRINPLDPAFSTYLTRTYNQDHIVKKTMEMLVVDKLGDPSGKRFIDLMIYQGKKAYVMKKILPTTSDTILMEYTPEQLAWVEDNQLQMWDFFLDKNLMYQTNHLEIMKYLQPAPTSKGMPPGSPGRTASYLGYKIVQAYMKRFPETTLPELVKLQDSQKILEESKYKPRRR